MAGKFDNVPQSVREAISIALFVGAITATAAALLHQPLFILGGLLLFAIAYFVRIRPMLQQEYLEQEEYQKKYSADDTYQPILDRFDETEDDDALIDAYNAWKMGPYDNEVKLRFLQSAIVALIDAGKIYRVEELMTEVGALAAAEGLDDRFQTFRAECDRRIAEIAQQRLEAPEEEPAELE
ncbi:MAG: hypothetical protein J5818_01135 [Eggerthellaceae bacterium]|nr:hypothetical protein [Eggerthellaceae bacterium]